MRRSRRRAGFGLIETLSTMLLVGVIIGLVARGYQALARLNLASYQMSQRMELANFLNRLSYEVASALAVTTSAAGFSFERIEPAAVLLHQPTSRLPSPLPMAPTAFDPIAASYRVTISYAFVPTDYSIARTAYGDTTTELANVGELKAAVEPSGRVLVLDMRPKEMAAPVKARILLPVVTP